MTKLENTVLGNSGHKLYRSVPVELIAGAAEITLDIDPAQRHWFAGVVYYSDAEGTTVVTPTAGVETVKAKSVVQPQGFQSLTNGILSASSIDQADWSDNSEQVKVTLVGVDVATHARFIVSGNLS